MDLVRTPRRLRGSIENGFRAVGGGRAVRMMDGVGSVAVTGWSQMRVLDGQAKAMRGLNNDLHSFQARAHLRRACKETTRRSRRRSRRSSMHSTSVRRSWRSSMHSTIPCTTSNPY
jgi:hypothetical protein